MPQITLTQTLEPHGPATAFLLSDEQVATLSTKKAFPVVVTVGQVSARLRVARMGGLNMVGLSKANRALLGVDIGDTVTAVLAEDTAQREVDVPEALASALEGDRDAAAAYEALSFTARKEMARSIAEAKQQATRERRLAKALATLRGEG